MDLSLLSKRRGELMGFAMIAVMLFHIGGFNHSTMWYCLSRCGNVGVDIFLFLSGIGLWFAWNKTPRLGYFYRRRLVRIYPAWLIIAGAYYIPQCVEGKLSIVDTILEMAVNWDFWHHLELTFWFVPAILLLYIVSPFYMRLITRHPVWRWMPLLAMTLELIILYWQPARLAVGHLEIFFSRIPIFLLGINIGETVRRQQTLDRQAWLFAVMLFAASLFACINFEDGLRGRFPLFLERWAYIPLAVTGAILLARLFDTMPSHVNCAFSFIGTISLEAYLIHIEFVLRNVWQYKLGYWSTAAVVISISLLAAWLVHKILDIVLKRR